MASTIPTIHVFLKNLTTGWLADLKARPDSAIASKGTRIRHGELSASRSGKNVVNDKSRDRASFIELRDWTGPSAEASVVAQETQPKISGPEAQILVQKTVDPMYERYSGFDLTGSRMLYQFMEGIIQAVQPSIDAQFSIASDKPIPDPLQPLPDIRTHPLRLSRTRTLEIVPLRLLLPINQHSHHLGMLAAHFHPDNARHGHIGHFACWSRQAVRRGRQDLQVLRCDYQGARVRRGEGERLFAQNVIAFAADIEGEVVGGRFRSVVQGEPLAAFASAWPSSARLALRAHAADCGYELKGCIGGGRSRGPGEAEPEHAIASSRPNKATSHEVETEILRKRFHRAI